MKMSRSQMIDEEFKLYGFGQNAFNAFKFVELLVEMMRSPKSI